MEFTKSKKSLILYFLLLLITPTVHCQTADKDSPAIKMGTPIATLGTDSLFSGPAIRSLEMIPRGSTMISSGNAGTVGGVAFEKTAAPVAELQINSLEINYVPENADGKRVQIFINGQLLENFLPDWQIIPIARYANSEYNACFTAFGQPENKNTALVDFINDRGGKLFGYHPAFENSLMGLRLMQTDILLMSTNSAELPKYPNGEYILGTGETAPNFKSNQTGFKNLYYHLMMCQNTCGISYRSYIICDYKQEIRFGINNNMLEFSGHPYYFCWKYKMDLPGFNADSAYTAIFMELQTTLDTITPDFDKKQSWFIGKLLPELAYFKMEHYTTGMDPFYDELFQLATTDEQESLLSQYDIESLANLLLNIRKTKVLNELIYLECLSDEFSAKQEYFSKTNPAVWQSVENTMWYGAFMRYCKANYPETWNRFISRIQGVQLSPPLQTPGVWIPSN